MEDAQTSRCCFKPGGDWWRGTECTEKKESDVCTSINSCYWHEGDSCPNGEEDPATGGVRLVMGLGAIMVMAVLFGLCVRNICLSSLGHRMTNASDWPTASECTPVAARIELLSLPGVVPSAVAVPASTVEHSDRLPEAQLYTGPSEPSTDEDEPVSAGQVQAALAAID